MFLFFEVLCAYFAAVGLFFLLREVYFCLSDNISTDKENEYVCIYVARDGEKENDARNALENEDFGGRVFVIYGDDKQTEKKITDLCIKHGKLYIKK